jgi:hypothetical protein
LRSTNANNPAACDGCSLTVETGQLYRVMPSTLTAMRCDDLSIWTTHSARAGVRANPDMTNAAANASLASLASLAILAPDSRFMITAPARYLPQA